jgi:glycosyltransferase involved in cell wall biosynthesis
MKIAIIAPPWVPVPPPAYGGTEAVLDTLARGVQAAGHDVLLYATGDSTCPVPIESTFERALGTVSTGAASELCHVVEAYERLLEWDPDVVHDHTLVGPVYSDRYDLPVVTTNHAPFQGELGPLYRMIAHTVPIIAISDHQAGSADDTPIAAVIHHGVDMDAHPMGGGEGGYALFLGRMSPTKGVHTAAKVAREAGMPLKIAAKMREPAEKEYFRERVEPLLGDGIEYMGEVAQPAKLDLLRDAICLLNPIEWDEPFGMVMIEAMACGTPIVATPRGSAPELIDDGVTGFVRHTFEGQLGAVLEASSLDRTKVREVAAERFSADVMVARHLRLYGRVIADHSPRRAA